MSYILDALKKAEAERQMGHVPHLHAHPGAASLPDMLPFYRKKPALIALLAAAGVICAAFAWYQPWRTAALKPPIEQVVPVVQQPVSPAQANPARMPSVAVNTTPEIVAVGPAPQTPKAPPSVEAAKPKKPAPAPAAKKPAPTLAAKKPTREPVAPATPVDTAIAKPGPENIDLKRHAALMPDVSNTPQVGAISDLPEQIRRELPNVIIGGYIYSDNARERQLLVNKRLLREGEEVAPGVILEKMQPKAAVFNYKGYRYRLAY